MAEPVKRGDKYRHSIMVEGGRMTDTFDTKKEARAWEASMRLKAKEGTLPAQKKHTLTAAVDKYLSSISTLKKQNAVGWDTRRFNTFLDFFPKRNIEDITSADIAAWRDHMLLTVSGSTVNRYANLYSNLFTIARKEWKWIAVSPWADVKRPKENAPRQVVWRWQQIRRILREGQSRGGKILETTQAFRIALHTSVRLKEALAAPAGFNPTTGVLTISDRKESHHDTPIKIPTFPRARRILTGMPKSFRVGANEASVLFSKLASQMGIRGLEFKDSRPTALTLMARRVPVEVLQRISRHKDINMLIRVYYRATAEEISSRL